MQSTSLRLLRIFFSPGDRRTEGQKDAQARGPPPRGRGWSRAVQPGAPPLTARRHAPVKGCEGSRSPRAGSALQAQYGARGKQRPREAGRSVPAADARAALGGAFELPGPRSGLSGGQCPPTRSPGRDAVRRCRRGRGDLSHARGTAPRPWRPAPRQARGLCPRASLSGGRRPAPPARNAAARGAWGPAGPRSSFHQVFTKSRTSPRGSGRK